MGKSIDKDALVPSKKLAFLTGILGGITETVKAQRAKEIEEQKRQFQIMKFFFPLQQKERELEQRQSQFETKQETELAGIEQRQLQFQTEQALALRKFDFTVSDAERERKFQLDRDRIKSELDIQLKGLGITAAQVRQQLQAFIDVKIQDLEQRGRENLQEDRQEFEKLQQQREQIFTTGERVATQQARAGERSNVDLKADLDASMAKVAALREELAKVTSEFDKEGIANLAKERAQDSIELWRVWAAGEIAEGRPVPPIPKGLEVFKDEGFFKRVTKLFGSTTFGVAPVQSPAGTPVKSQVQSPAQAITRLPQTAARKKEVSDIMAAVKRQYGKDVPEFVIQNLRSKYTEEEVQRIVGNGKN